MSEEYVRIWNERSQEIGGTGRDVVIQTLINHGFMARACEAEFLQHEGVEVPYSQVFKAASLVEKMHGRP